MEHREPGVEGATRDAVSEPEHRPRCARLGLVPPPATRRLVRTHPFRVGLAVALALIVALTVAARIVRVLGDWVDRRPEYQLAFRSIELDPPPPAWYRRGASGFLDRVRAGAREPESFSVLDLELDELVRDFKLNAWVERVQGAEKSYPNRVVVRLDYRVPVAKFYKDDTLVLDAEGVVLDAEDVDREALGPLVVLAGLKPPVAPKPGQVCKLGPASDGLERPDERAVVAARFAGFLASARRRDAPELAAVRNLTIHATEKLGWYVQCRDLDDALMFHWAEAPGQEPPGRPTAEVKWAWMLDWVRRHGPTSPRLYLEPSKTGFVAVPSAGPSNRGASGREK